MKHNVLPRGVLLCVAVFSCTCSSPSASSQGSGPAQTQAPIARAPLPPKEDAMDASMPSPTPEELASNCQTNLDCTVIRVHDCDEILSCQSSCPESGTPVAVLKSQIRELVAPICGPQPPCTPVCPPPHPQHQPARHALCVNGSCQLAPAGG